MLCLGLNSLVSYQRGFFGISGLFADWKCWACAYSQCYTTKIFQCLQCLFQPTFSWSKCWNTLLQLLCSPDAAVYHVCLLLFQLLCIPWEHWFSSRVSGCQLWAGASISSFMKCLLRCSFHSCVGMLQTLPWDQLQNWRHLRNEKLRVLWILSDKYSLCLRLPVGTSYWFISVLSNT